MVVVDAVAVVGQGRELEEGDRGGEEGLGPFRRGFAAATRLAGPSRVPAAAARHPVRARRMGCAAALAGRCRLLRGGLLPGGRSGRARRGFAVDDHLLLLHAPAIPLQDRVAHGHEYEPAAPPVLLGDAHDPRPELRRLTERHRMERPERASRPHAAGQVDVGHEVPAHLVSVARQAGSAAGLSEVEPVPSQREGVALRDAQRIAVEQTEHGLGGPGRQPIRADPGVRGLPGRVRCVAHAHTPRLMRSGTGMDVSLTWPRPGRRPRAPAPARASPPRQPAGPPCGPRVRPRRLRPPCRRPECGARARPRAPTG